MDSFWLKTTLRAKKVTQRSLGEAIGLTQDKINKALAHVRQFSPIEAIKIADFLEVHGVSRSETLNAILGKDAALLQKGVGERRDGHYQSAASAQVKPVPVIGTVGQGGVVQYLAPGTSKEQAPAPAAGSQPESLVALKVQGNYLTPAYQDGELLYYNDHGKIDSKALNREAIVELQDGKKLLRVVKPSAMEGRYNLEAFHSPIMEIVSLKSASPVLWTKKI